MKTIKNIILKISQGIGLLKFYQDFKQREIKTKYGEENPDTYFYVIGQNDHNGGLFWLINKVLMHISYAEEMGYVPIVDMQNFSSQYLDPSLLHKVNAWEYFFQQPCGYSLESISKSRNIVISKKDAAPNMKHFMGNFYDNEQRINHFSNLYSKYIKLNPDIQTKINQTYNNILSGRRVVGVLCRGTDYVASKPSGHPIPPSPELMIKKIKDVQIQFNCEYVFLATEDKDILQVFINEFGDTLLYNKQERISSSEVKNKNFLAEARLGKGVTVEQRIDMGIQYFEAIFLLSKCNCFVSSRCGGAKGVLLMNNNFEYKYIYDLGMYK